MSLPASASSFLAAPVLAMLVLLAACAFPAGGSSRGPVAEEGSLAVCLRSCNRSYDVCAESGAARAGSGPFSGEASCGRDLRQCQAGCRASE